MSARIHYQDPQVELWHGDALECARQLPDEYVRTIVTSPPYFGLRDYDADGQVGVEQSVPEYVERLVMLFRELRRVLADDGTLWLNLGDSYASSGGKQGVGPNAAVGNTLKQRQNRTRPRSDLPTKNLLGVPWRVALALQDDGWILRADNIWSKPNAMPESVTDRPTRAHEYVFLLAKSPRYYYDAASVRTPATRPAGGRTWAERKEAGAPGRHGLAGAAAAGDSHFAAPDGSANLRTVWTVPTQPFSGAHFAVYPPQLIRPCILAGSAAGDRVLDPFSGSGTTGAVALQEGREYVGIDLNADYLDLSLRERFAQPPLVIGDL